MSTDEPRLTSSGGRGAASPSPRRPNAYSLLLPAGWYRLSPRDNTRASSEAVIRAMLRDGDARGELEARRRIAAYLRELMNDAQRAGVLDLYLPLSSMSGAVVPAMIAVAELGAEVGEDPMQMMLAVAARDASARSVDVSGSVALRTEARVSARMAAEEVLRAVSTSVGSDRQDPAVEGSLSTLYQRRVVYFVGVPGDSARWVTVSFAATVSDTAEGAASEVVFVELFDAIMTTFAWK